MFDNLSDSDSDQRAFQEAMGLGATPEAQEKSSRGAARRGLLGMSAPQRFVISLLLLLAVIMIGTMCLLVTGRISAF